MLQCVLSLSGQCKRALPDQRRPPITRPAARRRPHPACPQAQHGRTRQRNHSIVRRQFLAQRARRVGSLWRHRGARQRELRCRSRRHLRPDRPQRSGQDHAVQLHEPAVSVPGRRHPARGPIAHQRADPPHRDARPRAHVSEPGDVPHAHRHRQRDGRGAFALLVRLRVERAAAAQGRRRGSSPARTRARDHGLPRPAAVRQPRRRRPAVRDPEARRIGAGAGRRSRSC